MSNDHDQEDKQFEGVDLSKIDPETATPEEVAAAIKVGQTALAQRAKWKERAIDPSTGKPYKDLLAERTSTPSNSSDNVTPPEKQTTPDVQARIERLEQGEEKRTFQYAHNLSPEETDIVFAQAKGMGQKPEDVIKTPFIATALKEFRKQKSVDNATPSPSSRQPQVDGKTFAKMSRKEQAENFEAVRDKLIGK